MCFLFYKISLYIDTTLMNNEFVMYFNKFFFVMPPTTLAIGIFKKKVTFVFEKVKKKQNNEYFQWWLNFI